MALQPSLRPLIILGRPEAPHTLDVFCTSQAGVTAIYTNCANVSLLIIVDYVCPFSAKLSRAVDNVLAPLLGPGGKYDGKVKVIFRNQVQPWHGSSTFVHEAGLAVARVAPEHFWKFSRAVSYVDHLRSACVLITAAIAL